MKIDIGSNLKRLRLAKDLTQEQVGEAFGVSPQAVSRWENNTAYPDITLLPGLAIFYNTTVDAIVGMDEIKRDEALSAIHTEINRLVAGGQTAEAVALIRDSLRLYPNDSGLMMSLGETLAHRTDDPAALEEAILIDERVLQNTDVSMKARSTTSANLLFLYLRTGREEKAKTLVKSLPHIWESREILMPETYDGEAYIEQLRASVLKTLVFLCSKIDGLPIRVVGSTPDYIQLGVDFEPKKDIRKMLEQIESFLL